MIINNQSATTAGSKVGKYFNKNLNEKEIRDIFYFFGDKEGVRFRWRDIRNNAHNNLHSMPIEPPSVHDAKGEVL